MESDAGEEMRVMRKLHFCAVEQYKLETSIERSAAAARRTTNQENGALVISIALNLPIDCDGKRRDVISKHSVSR